MKSPPVVSIGDKFNSKERAYVGTDVWVVQTVFGDYFTALVPERKSPLLYLFRTSDMKAIGCEIARCGSEEYPFHLVPIAPPKEEPVKEEVKTETLNVAGMNVEIGADIPEAFGEVISALGRLAATFIKVK